MELKNYIPVMKNWVFQHKMLDKKGVSAIIATLLIIMLTIVIFSVIYSVMIPAVKNYLGESKTCFDALDKVKINKDELTCYNEETGETGISVKRDDVELDEIIISLIGEGDSRKFEISDNMKSDNIRMYYSNYSQELELPGKLEERTYVFKTSFEVDRALIAIQMDNINCKISEEENIEKC